MYNIYNIYMVTIQ